jgi:hypothetical protein
MALPLHKHKVMAAPRMNREIALVIVIAELSGFSCHPPSPRSGGAGFGFIHRQD